MAILAEASPTASQQRLRVLDIGGGTGGMAVPLAELGHEVTVVDPSPDALAALDRRAREAGALDRLRAVQGDTTSLVTLCEPGTIDLACCHGVLEVVDDPAASVADIAATLAPGGTVSIVVANRLAAVLTRAIHGRLAQAREVLVSDDGRWGDGDPLPRRFDPDVVERLVVEAGLEVVTSHGVRVLSDLVPSAQLDTDADRAALLDLERTIASTPHGAALGLVAASWHVVARRV